MYLEVASQALVLVFVLSTLFSVGLLVSVRQVLVALQQRRWLAIALCANFVVLPGTALALAWWLQVAAPLQAALLLVATAPGSPVLLRLNEFARGDQAKAVGLLVLLTSLTMVYQPLVLPLLLPGVSVSPIPIARTLMLTVLLPLVLGLLLKARWPALAGRLRPILAWLGNISAVLSFHSLADRLLGRHQGRGLEWRRLAGSIALPASGRGRRLVVGRSRRGPTTLVGDVLRPRQHGSGICHCRP